MPTNAALTTGFFCNLDAGTPGCPGGRSCVEIPIAGGVCL